MTDLFGRIRRASEIVANNGVSECLETPERIQYNVHSTPNRSWLVDYDGKRIRCNCNDGLQGGKLCKHQIAVLFYEREKVMK